MGYIAGMILVYLIFRLMYKVGFINCFVRRSAKKIHEGATEKTLFIRDPEKWVGGGGG